MSKTVIDVREAVKSASAYLRSIQDMISDSNAIVTDVRLEEVELSEDEEFWFITLSYVLRMTTQSTSSNPLSEVFSASYGREYKLIKVDAHSGAVKSMKIREL